MADECEVCTGRHGEPTFTVTFAHDSDAEPTPVRMCLACVQPIFGVMVSRWNEAIANDNAEVAAMCKMLGIDFPVARTP